MGPSMCLEWLCRVPVAVLLLSWAIMMFGCLPGALTVFLVSSRLGFSPTLVEPNSFLSVWLLDCTITASGLPRLALAGYCSALLGSFRLFGVSLDSRRHFGATLWRVPRQHLRSCWAPEGVLVRFGAAKPLGYLPGFRGSRKHWAYLSRPRSKPQDPKHKSLRVFQTAVCILDAYGTPPLPRFLSPRECNRIIFDGQLFLAYYRDMGMDVKRLWGEYLRRDGHCDRHIVTALFAYFSVGISGIACILTLEWCAGGAVGHRGRSGSLGKGGQKLTDAGQNSRSGVKL